MVQTWILGLVLSAVTGPFLSSDSPTKAQIDDVVRLLGDRETRDPEGKPGMRADLATALDKLGKSKVTFLLLLFQENGDPEVRRGASYALGEIGDLAAVPVLLNDYLEYSRSPVSEADLGKLDDPRIVEALVGLLESDDEEEQQRGSRAMAQLRGKTAIPILIPLVKHETVLLRARAVEALGSIGDPSAVPTLIAALDDSNDGVVIFAARGLARIGDARAIDPLKKRLAKVRSDFWMTRLLRQAITDVNEKVKAAGKPAPANESAR